MIGGSVDKHCDTGHGLFAWALYFNEYGLFMPPVVSGPAAIVPGSNVSYKRALLFDGPKARYAVFWKTFVNQDAEASGRDLSGIDYYVALGYWKLAIILEGVYARYAAGQYGKVDPGIEHYARLVERLAEAAEAVERA